MDLLLCIHFSVSRNYYTNIIILLLLLLPLNAQQTDNYCFSAVGDRLVLWCADIENAFSLRLAFDLFG